MYSRPISPQSIGGVLDSGFTLYRYALKETFIFAFLSALISVPSSRLAQPATPADINFGLLGIAALVTIAASVILFVPIIAKINAIQKGDSLSAGDALALGVQRFLVVFLVVLLYFAAVMGGLMLLLIPGIYVMVALVFSTIAAIVDRKGPLESLRYSFELVRGRWWRTAVLLTIISIVAFVLYFLVFFVIGIALAIGSGGQAQQVPWQVELVVSPLMAGVLMPLFYSLLMSAYADTKLRHEGDDIAERIAAAEA